jgi:hypothetical protein
VGAPYGSSGFGVSRLVGVSASFAAIARHDWMLSSQMNTPGPDLSVATPVCPLPPKKQ